MLSTGDYYEVLGVARDADEQTIKAAFHRLARRYHPDRSTEPDAEERFKEVTEAYAVLSDPAKRADYDAGGSTPPFRMTAEDRPRDIDLRDLLDAGLDLGGSVFARLFNVSGDAGGIPSRGPDVHADVEVPLSAVVTGTEAPVRFSHTQTCHVCRGSGAKPGTTPVPCRACGGTGQRTLTGWQGTVLVRRAVICEQCLGTGRQVRQPCAACSGRGNTQVEETVTVKIPPGVEEDTVLRVRGRGQPSPVPGGPAGDLEIVVHSAPHPDFERRGPDLYHREAIPVTDAVLGTHLTVANLQDTVTVKVPPGTQPGTVLRLAGQGLPHVKRRGRGDMYLTIDVLVPASLTAPQRQLYEQLRTSPAAVKRRSWRRRSGQTHQPEAPETNGRVKARRSRRARLVAQVRQLVRAIDQGDDASVEAAVRQLSQSRRYLAPLAFAVGALVMLFNGLKLLITNWRLSLIQILPAMWIWVAMLDLKLHVFKGRELRYWQGSFAFLLVSLVVILSMAAFYLNAVFAFAISRPGKPQIRPAFSSVHHHLPVVLGGGAVVGLALGVSAVVVPRWGLWWFTFSLSIVLAVMMLTYVTVPSRLAGIQKSAASPRDKLTAAATGSALGAIVCTPAYLVGRIGILLLGTHTLFFLGVILLSLGLTLQAGATGAVKAIKMSAKLASGRALPEPTGSTDQEVESNTTTS